MLRKPNEIPLETFDYVRDGDGNLRIALDHSSLPVGRSKRASAPSGDVALITD